MIDFEWDEARRLSNLAKHRLDFSAAWRVFEDTFANEEEERSMDYGEPRFKITGLVDDVLITVIFTERTDVRRIISMRRATATERRIYEEG